MHTGMRMLLTRSMQVHLRRLLRSPQKVRGCCCFCTTSKQLDTEKESAEGQQALHVPVLVKEVLEKLNPQRGKVYLDMTFGAGGHTKAILEQEEDLQIYALDRDPFAQSLATKLAVERPQVLPLPGKFSEAEELLETYSLGPNSVDGILFDLGVSSMQFGSRNRGFAINLGGPLDMRMDGNRFPDQPNAADVVNHLDIPGLTQILKKYGEEKQAKKIAAAIVDSRNAFGRIETTRQLADIVSAASKGRQLHDKLSRPMHTATRTFQALRIFVNNELNELNSGLEVAHRLLRPGGVCVVIAFHSLEDRIVKHHFHEIHLNDKSKTISAEFVTPLNTLSESDFQELLSKRWKPLCKKIIVPSEEEIQRNPRSRSAKLRAAIKI